MEKVSIICCYNRSDILEAMLEKGLENQKGVCIERLFYNNKFSSAAETYNYAYEQATAEYLVFVHQDIKFDQEDFLLRLVEYVKNNQQALFGLCGTRKDGDNYETVSNTFHGFWNRRVGNDLITELVQVEGLDEILIACHRSVLTKIQFDNETFDGWHGFVADLCIQAKLCNINTYVMPLASQHKNALEMPKYIMAYKILPREYFIYLRRLRNKYKGKLDMIATPCATIKTSFLGFWMKFTHMKVKAYLRLFLRKMSLK